jgi:DNA-binding MarR family transcriptional regulator
MAGADPGATRGCACASVRRAGRVMTQLYDGVLAPSGLRATQFSLLSRLANAGPLTLGDLAEAMVMDRTTLTRNLAPLERAGWVRTVRGDDRRRREVTITDEGRAMVARALPLWQVAQERVAGGFGPERLAALRAELAALTAMFR